MRSVLISWIGFTDLRAQEEDAEGVGPGAKALEAGGYDAAFLLTTHGGDAERYRAWLEGRANGARLALLHERLTSPTDFGEIYTAAKRACERTRAAAPDAALTFHLSPGTPAMAAVWVILPRRASRPRSFSRQRSTASVPSPSPLTSRRTSSPTCCGSRTGSWSV